MSTDQRVQTAEDIFDILSENHLVRYPTSWKDWAVAEYQPVRPRMFKIRDYRGVKTLLPQILRQFPPRYVPDDQYSRYMMRVARPAIRILRNPNRVALMVPCEEGWEERKAIFCHTPRQWQTLEQRVETWKLLKPDMFHIRLMYLQREDPLRE
jgi:hypothetical protein